MPSLQKNKFYVHKIANGKDNAYSFKRFSGEFCGNVGVSIDFLIDFILCTIKDFDKFVDAALNKVSREKFLNNIKVKYCSIAT